MVRSTAAVAIHGLIAGVCLAIVAGPALSAERNPAVPDFSGKWGRNSLDFEPPSSGPGPVVNLAHRPNGTRDLSQLVGDYNNPILNPAAADQVKRLGGISRSGVTFPIPTNQCWPEQPPLTVAG